LCTEHRRIDAGVQRGRCIVGCSRHRVSGISRPHGSNAAYRRPFTTAHVFAQALTILPRMAGFPAMYCRKCGYEASPWGTARCPECGAPASARTQLVRPPWRAWWIVAGVAAANLVLLWMIAAVTARDSRTPLAGLVFVVPLVATVPQVLALSPLLALPFVMPPQRGRMVRLSCILMVGAIVLPYGLLVVGSVALQLL